MVFVLVELFELLTKCNNFLSEAHHHVQGTNSSLFSPPAPVVDIQTAFHSNHGSIFLSQEMTWLGYFTSLKILNGDINLQDALAVTKRIKKNLKISGFGIVWNHTTPLIKLFLDPPRVRHVTPSKIVY